MFLTHAQTRTTAGAFNTIGKTIGEWEVIETGASTAEIELRDGSASGQIRKRVKLASGQSVGDHLTHPWRLSAGDLTLVITSGTVQVTCQGTGV